MISFEKSFEKAKKPSDSEFLEFYKLFKLAMVGDCNIEKPGAFDLKKKAMWEAWNTHKGMPQIGANEAYIRVYEKYVPKYA